MDRDMKWRQTAETSPVHQRGRRDGSETPSRWNTFANEYLNILPLSDSPGTADLGTLSLDTPKRKAEVLTESIPSDGKVKLRELSRKNLKELTTSQVALCYKSLAIV